VIEAILFSKSRMSPKIAILKPLSSGIAIGSGGPFGAQGAAGRGRLRRYDRSVWNATCGGAPRG
jgi:hypothetical protein